MWCRKGNRAQPRKDTTMNTYLVCYKDDAGEAYGVKELRGFIAEGKKLGDPVLHIYKHGKNFKNDPDDIIDVTDRYIKEAV